MYNRYTPSPDGTFQRTVVPDAPPPKPPEPEVCACAQEPPRPQPPKPKPPSAPPPPKPQETCMPAPPPVQPASCPPDRPLRKLLPRGIDPGDLLVLLVLLLVLMETDEKVKLALANNLKPIFCIGEVLEEREANKQNEVVAAQLASVFSLSAEDFSKIILAYEPVWAIGTGKTATAEQAQEIHAFIRSLIADKYGKEVADNTSILYGGSCKPSNAKELFANPDVDGGLIGGAALKVVDFKGIIDAFK